MKAKVTLKLDAGSLHEVRVLAAGKGCSVNALLTEHLEALVRERKQFGAARRRALARMHNGLGLHWTPPASRDDLHERWR